jgi:hypothetical protein
MLSYFAILNNGTLRKRATSETLNLQHVSENSGALQHCQS